MADNSTRFTAARDALGDFAPKLVELITHLAFYAGWPSAMSAVPIAKELLEKRAKGGQE